MSLKIENLKIDVAGFIIHLQSLEVAPGEIVCLMGKSGSGKSTILKAVAGFIPILEGTVSVDGRSVEALPPEKRKVALVFQTGTLFPHLTVVENVEFGLRVQKVEAGERRRRAMEWLNRLEIQALAERKSSEISGGEAQRVALARASVVGFPVLLLDEPFSALDTSLRRTLRKATRDLVRETKCSVLLVSHDPADALEIADRMAVLDGGSLVQIGRPSELKTHPKTAAVSELLGS